ncbi:hypothetical protein K445DRAFT_17465 [Daldinia sp. EC12]|nr:hypothetical protein K445DRAFT_17465 [Daldinia sp. EC12]
MFALLLAVITATHLGDKCLQTSFQHTKPSELARSLLCLWVTWKVEPSKPYKLALILLIDGFTLRGRLKARDAAVASLVQSSPQRVLAIQKYQQAAQ